ncbi:hypothetical protein B5V03_06240 [Bradyrhizobium betae]|uniref:Uncharacterized protein n=1 Tax=Bradyrhizobium betae TaxID=244734 RepID=A0A4Q1VEY4_9BRAD|nr:hypothetical protein B5V03_06240 [Bradyrhizobium betae]
MQHTCWIETVRKFIQKVCERRLVVHRHRAFLMQEVASYDTGATGLSQARRCQLATHRLFARLRFDYSYKKIEGN